MKFKLYSIVLVVFLVGSIMLPCSLADEKHTGAYLTSTSKDHSNLLYLKTGNFLTLQVSNLGDGELSYSLIYIKDNKEKVIDSERVQPKKILTKHFCITEGVISPGFYKLKLDTLPKGRIEQYSNGLLFARPNTEYNSPLDEGYVHKVKLNDLQDLMRSIQKEVIVRVHYNKPSWETFFTNFLCPFGESE